MSRVRVPATDSASHTPRVLVLATKQRASAVVDALTAGACAVEVVKRVSDLSGRLTGTAPDALLIDLSGDDAVKTGESEVRKALARLTEGGDMSGETERLRKTVAFARATAHDLAQPLTTILARAQLLMSSMRPEDPHYRVMSIICAEAERLANTAAEFNKLKEMAAETAAQKA